MARKRMIDPEFWSDEEIAHWSFQARLFYIGLWNFADDKGRLKAHPSLLKSQIFPYETQKININALKNEVKRKVVWFTKNGQQYGFLRNFLKHQRIDRPSDSKLPSPPRKFVEHSSKPLRDVPPNIIEDNIIEDKRREKPDSKEPTKENKSYSPKGVEPSMRRFMNEALARKNKKG